LRDRNNLIIPNLGIPVSAIKTNALRKKNTASHRPSRHDSALADALLSSTQQRELARLAQSGLVTVTKVGNQKHYQANHDSPLFNVLCSIIEKTVGLQEPIRAALKPLSDNIHLALIYGSIAKQSDTAASDIDLLLESDVLTLEDVYSALAPAEKLLDRRVNPTLYDSREFEHRRNTNNAFLTRVLTGPTIALIGAVDGE